MSRPESKRHTLSSRETEDRRREPRLPATGAAVLYLNHGERMIHAEVLDVSRSGCRVRYFGEPFLMDDEVRIAYSLGEVPAAAVWVKCDDGWVEVGLLILE